MQSGRRVTTPRERRRAAKLGRLLRSQRDGVDGLSAQGLAGSAAVSVDLVRKIEAGKVADPGFFTMGRLLESLGGSLDELYQAAERTR